MRLGALCFLPTVQVVNSHKLFLWRTRVHFPPPMSSGSPQLVILVPGNLTGPFGHTHICDMYTHYNLIEINMKTKTRCEFSACCSCCYACLLCCYACLLSTAASDQPELAAEHLLRLSGYLGAAGRTELIVVPMNDFARKRERMSKRV